MRPPSVYANPACTAGCPCDLLALLQGPTASACAGHDPAVPPGLDGGGDRRLLGCDPATVRRWIHRYNTHGTDGLPDQPRAGRLRLGNPRLGQRILRLLAQPKAWTIGRLWSQLGRPAVSQCTLRRRVGQVAAWRRPIAKGRP